MINLENRKFLITGATSGIGKGIAETLHGLGAVLVITGRDESKLKKLSESLGGRHLYKSFDLENADEIPVWIKTITSETGPLNGFVHSAGICQLLPLQALSAKRFGRTMNLNVLSAMMLVKAFLQPDCIYKDSSIVLIASTAGIVGCPGQTLYTASKGALIAFVRGAALELAHLKIRVNSVSPACVETPMLDYLKQSIPEDNYQHLIKQHALGIGSPQDVAQATAFLLSSASRWITGTDLVADGGLTAA